jgi:hypothetical protein
VRHALGHPLHLLAIAGGAIGLAYGLWTGQGDSFCTAALALGMSSAIDLARRLGLEPPSDLVAPATEEGPDGPR